MQLYSICFGLIVGLVDTDVVLCISVAVNWLICCTCWLDGLWLCGGLFCGCDCVVIRLLLWCLRLCGSLVAVACCFVWYWLC